MQLSEHFVLSEFLVSQTAARAGWAWPQVPPEVLENLCRLAAEVGEPLRREMGGRPVVVSSGWRYPRLNRRIGGARRSAHIDGRAMDITVPGVPLRHVAEALAGIEASDKVILEFDSWIHAQVAHPGATPRRQCLCAYRGQGRLGRRPTCYATGFVPPHGW